jgi:hypothetical protein
LKKEEANNALPIGKKNRKENIQKNIENIYIKKNLLERP